MPLSEIFNSVDNGRNEIRKIHIGGPVQESEVQILQVTQNPVSDSIKVASNVYLGGYWDSLDLISQSKNNSLRLFLGYSGWGSKQLENEIKLGSWEVHLANIEEIMKLDEDPWQKSIEDFKHQYCHI